MDETNDQKEPQLTLEAKEAIRGYLLKVLIPPATIVTIFIFVLGFLIKHGAEDAAQAAVQSAYQVAAGNAVKDAYSSISIRVMEIASQAAATSEKVKQTAQDADTANRNAVGAQERSILTEKTISQALGRMNTISNVTGLLEGIQNYTNLSAQITDRLRHDSEFKASLLQQVTPVPKGTIVAWYAGGAAVPAGWALCDGTTGTPDLRGRFLRGAANPSDSGQTGGSETHTHEVWQTTNFRGEGFQTEGNRNALGRTTPASNLPPFFTVTYIMKL